jgi:hypothetical protein
MTTHTPFEIERDRLTKLLATVEAQGACKRTVKAIRFRLEQMAHSAVAPMGAEGVTHASASQMRQGIDPISTGPLGRSASRG